MWGVKMFQFIVKTSYVIMMVVCQLHQNKGGLSKWIQIAYHI